MRDLHRQYEAMKAEMDGAVNSVVVSGNFILGSPVDDLEQRLAAYVGVRHCVTCASGTDALQLALMAWGIGKGDAVFVPDFTFFATAEVVALQGATPIFVDVCEDNFNIDATDLSDKIHHVEKHSKLHPAAVVAVDLFGCPADYDKLKEICRTHKLMLLEDGAQGFGGAIDGAKACSFGDIATTSFFPAKPLGCYGDGGALFTNNDRWAEQLRSLRVHGHGTDKYDNVRVGRNSRLDTIQAAVLGVKLNHFDAELASVERIAHKYNESLAGKVDVPVVHLPTMSSWAQYTIKTDRRDELKARLNEAGVPSAIYYPRTMSQQTAFSSIRHLQQPCPVADRLTSRVLSLPMHPYLTDKEIELIIELI